MPLCTGASCCGRREGGKLQTTGDRYFCMRRSLMHLSIDAVGSSAAAGPVWRAPLRRAPPAAAAGCVAVVGAIRRPPQRQAGAEWQCVVELWVAGDCRSRSTLMSAVACLAALSIRSLPDDQSMPHGCACRIRCCRPRRRLPGCRRALLRQARAPCRRCRSPPQPDGVRSFFLHSFGSTARRPCRAPLRSSSNRSVAVLQ